MTNINITIPDKLHKELKIRAAIEEKTLKELITEALIEYSKNKRGGKK